MGCDPSCEDGSEKAPVSTSVAEKGSAAKPAGKKRRISAAARKAMAEGAKRRWAAAKTAPDTKTKAEA